MTFCLIVKKLPEKRLPSMIGDAHLAATGHRSSRQMIFLDRTPTHRLCFDVNIG